jgi:2-methylcitrate dehydratase PrpD
MPEYLDELVSYVCRTNFNDLPQSVVLRAKEVLADTLSVIAAGAQEEEVKALTKRLVDPKARPVASLVGPGTRTEPLKAALINGTAGTFLELDEGNQFGRGHPGIHVVPAALAIAEEGRLSGRDLVAALLLGYEIGTRIGIACKIRMSMHPHGTWGTVGAAVAVGKLMGYGEAEMKEMINVSSSLGLATSRRTMLEGGTVRNVYSGVSNFMGVLSHQLVQSGFTGEADGLKTVYGSVVSDTFSQEVMTEELGERFEIARNYFKMHACCRYNHGTVDAMEKILAQRLFKADEVESVDVETYSLADPVWGHARAEQIRSQLMGVEKVRDVNQVTALIAPLA